MVKGVCNRNHVPLRIFFLFDAKNVMLSIYVYVVSIEIVNSIYILLE